MSDGDRTFADEQLADSSDYAVGYRRPPVRSRFKPGVSGNPSGRRKGSKNIRTIFEKILGEEISLREGSVTKKITKAEAIVRSLVIGAMKGDPRSQRTCSALPSRSGSSVRPGAVHEDRKDHRRPA